MGRYRMEKRSTERGHRIKADGNLIAYGSATNAEACDELLRRANAYDQLFAAISLTETQIDLEAPERKELARCIRRAMKLCTAG